MTSIEITSMVDEAVQAVCPIDGISFGRIADKSTWQVQPKATATPAQIAAARAAIDDLDTSPAGIDQWKKKNAKDRTKDRLQSDDPDSRFDRGLIAVMADWMDGITKAVKSGKPADIAKLPDISRAKLEELLGDELDKDAPNSARVR